jgi:hypothetical protein
MVWNLGTRRKPKFYLKKAVTSFSKVIELDFPSSFQLTVAKDSVAASLMTDMRGRTKKWVKVVVTGPPIPDDNTKNHTLTIISPVEIIASDRGDKDDLYTATFNMDSILDTVFGSGIQVVIRCGVDTLTNVTRLATLYAALQ